MDWAAESDSPRLDSDDASARGACYVSGQGVSAEVPVGLMGCGDEKTGCKLGCNGQTDVCIALSNDYWLPFRLFRLALVSRSASSASPIAPLEGSQVVRSPDCLSRKS